MKSYFLVFGASNDSAREVADFLDAKIEVCFQQVGSFFRGWYFFAQLYIANNFFALEQEWLELEDQEFKIIIYVQIAQGKSRDRLSLHKWLKSQLSQCDNLTFLTEEILEDSA